jgi:hypothetical protein
MRRRNGKVTLKLLRGRRLLGVAAAAIGLTAALATPAMAHTPILLTNRDALPWTSPLIVDGTDPVAMFGVLPRCPALRSAQFRMQAGEPILLACGIPDEVPENQLPASSLPDLILIAPDGGITVLVPTIRQVISPDGLGVTMQLLLVGRYSAPAVTGTYSVMLVGGCPAARVVVALGSDPGDFDGVLRGNVATTDQLEMWYNTPPPTDPDAAHRFAAR